MSTLLWEYERLSDSEKDAEARRATIDSDLIDIRRKKHEAWRAYLDSLPSAPTTKTDQGAGR